MPTNNAKFYNAIKLDSLKMYAIMSVKINLTHP